MYKISSEDELFNLWLLLDMTMRGLTRTREKELASLNITPEQCQILYIIKITEGRLYLSDIARMTLREPHSVSSIIMRMEKKGLVKKVKDQKYKNRIRAILTDKGKYTSDCSAKRETVHAIMSQLDGKERSSLFAYLEKLLHKSIEELDRLYVSPYQMPE